MIDHAQRAREFFGCKWADSGPNTAGIGMHSPACQRWTGIYAAPGSAAGCMELAAEFAAVRSEAIEECARVARPSCLGTKEPFNIGCCPSCHEFVAAQIRSLSAPKEDER